MLSIYLNARHIEKNRKHPNKMSEAETLVADKINKILCIQQQDCSANHDTLVENLRALRNLCARGPHVQILIARDPNLHQFVYNLLFHDIYFDEELMKQVQTIAWQMLANVIVNNEETQDIIWQRYSEAIAMQCLDLQRPIDRNTDISLMIVYNLMKSKGESANLQFPAVLSAAVRIWWKVVDQKSSLQLDFLHFIMEEFVVKNGRECVRCFAKMEPGEKLTFLDYLMNYIRSDNPNGPIHTFLLQYISKEFKIKSDCILKVSSLQEVDQMKPREAYALLQCIASASGSELYGQIYATDPSLFLNVSSMLRCLVSAGKELENNIFTPMNKLEEVAPTSCITRDYQKEISFELKTLLVRTVANLLHNNPTNQGYCLDTQLLPALFECTNMDARNPLVKEWSILAIRNACIGCPEIQQVIANLTSEGPAKNDVLSELNLDMGSLRINPGKD